MQTIEIRLENYIVIQWSDYKEMNGEKGIETAFDAKGHFTDKGIIAIANSLAKDEKILLSLAQTCDYAVDIILGKTPFNESINMLKP